MTGGASPRANRSSVSSRKVRRNGDRVPVEGPAHDRVLDESSCRIERPRLHIGLLGSSRGAPHARAPGYTRATQTVGSSPRQEPAGPMDDDALRSHEVERFPYPPACTGMRGSHPGSFDAGHAIRDGVRFEIDGLPVEDAVDLVVAGSGISGLAAAWFFRRRRPDASILLLDNHDDFGGHAKRNEFRVGDRLLIGYGGSEALQSPNSLYSDVAKGLLRSLGVDIRRFETAFDRELYPSLGLSRGVFFARETFGVDTL